MKPLKNPFLIALILYLPMAMGVMTGYAITMAIELRWWGTLSGLITLAVVGTVYHVWNGIRDREMR